MRGNNDNFEANFCKLIREWYEAEDNPGISAIDRFDRRFALRDWLLSSVQFNSFPPYGSYVKGIPIVLYEGLLTSFERKTQLYACAGPYNQRAISTLDIENFFRTFKHLDPWGHGVLAPDDIPHAMGTAVEILQELHNPDRWAILHVNHLIWWFYQNKYSFYYLYRFFYTCKYIMYIM